LASSGAAKKMPKKNSTSLYRRFRGHSADSLTVWRPRCNSVARKI
jgi:hypothetical protein